MRFPRAPCRLYRAEIRSWSLPDKFHGRGSANNSTSTLSCQRIAADRTWGDGRAAQTGNQGKHEEISRPTLHLLMASTVDRSHSTDIDSRDRVEKASHLGAASRTGSGITNASTRFSPG